MRLTSPLRPVVVTLCCAWLVVAVGLGAEPNPVAATTPTAAEAGESFVDFVNTTTKGASLPMKVADLEGASPELRKRGEDMLARIDAVAVRITPAEKATRLKEMEAMTQLQKWLLRSSEYGNFILAARIECAVSRMVTAALLDGAMTVDEARMMIGKLDAADRKAAVMAVVAPYVGGSQVMKSFQRGNFKGKDGSLFGVAEAFGRERGEAIEPNDRLVLGKGQPASFLFLTASGALNRFIATEVVHYLSKGGNCQLDWEELATDVRQRTPELVDQTESFSGLKVRVARVFGYLTEMRTHPNPF